MTVGRMWDVYGDIQLQIDRGVEDLTRQVEIKQGLLIHVYLRRLNVCELKKKKNI